MCKSLLLLFINIFVLSSGILVAADQNNQDLATHPPRVMQNPPPRTVHEISPCAGPSVRTLMIAFPRVCPSSTYLIA